MDEPAMKRMRMEGNGMMPPGAMPGMNGADDSSASNAMPTSVSNEMAQPMPKPGQMGGNMMGGMMGGKGGMMGSLFLKVLSIQL